MEDSIYLVIHHRNHKRILSSEPLTSEDYILNYDFTSSPSNVFGGDKSLIDLGNDKWGMIPGNGINDDQINNQDKNDNWYFQQGQTGYLQGDFNLDGLVNENDLYEVWNLSVGMGSDLPAN